MIQFGELRMKKPAIPQIAYYDKQSRETVPVEGSGFIDDIIDMDSYVPILGANNNLLIKSIWPDELHDFINASKESGRKINKQIMELSQTIKSDNNPILIVAHLKSNMIIRCYT